MNKRKTTTMLLTLLMLASPIYSSEAKMRKKCVSFPGERMIISSQNTNQKRCITDGFKVDCKDTFDKDTLKSVSIFQQKISANKYLYTTASDKQVEVTSNCGQLGIKQTNEQEIQLPGFETVSVAVDLTCSGFIGRNRQFRASCSAPQIHICYVDGHQVSPALWAPPPSPCISLKGCNLCITFTDIESDINGRFRK